MKMITLFATIGLLLVTGWLDAGQSSGEVSIAPATGHSSTSVGILRTAPGVQNNPARIVRQAGVNTRTENGSQRSAARQAQTGRDQNQSQINSATAIAAATRQARHEWHDRDWWRRHFRTIVFVLGGYYCLDDGYWSPALGYDPNDSYDDDGPIYAYGDLLPDQVIAKVQNQLHQDGYYPGPITGSINPSTRAALVNYQWDHGLIVTATVDKETVESLGLI